MSCDVTILVHVVTVRIVVVIMISTLMVGILRFAIVAGVFATGPDTAALLLLWSHSRPYSKDRVWAPRQEFQKRGTTVRGPQYRLLLSRVLH